MAVYQYVSSDEVVASVYGTFKVNYSDWKGWARQWIADALNLMEIFDSFEDVSVDVYFDNYTAALPVKLKNIRAIEYEGVRIKKSDAINHNNRDRSRQVETSYVTYKPAPSNRAIKLSVEEGCITIHYKGMPVDCNGFPIVADNGNLKEALKWYCMYQMLLNGYEHPTGIVWEKAFDMFNLYHGRAKTSVGRVDADGRYNHMLLWTSLIRNYSAWGNTHFEPTNCERCVEATCGEENHKITFTLNVAGATISLEPTVAIFAVTDTVSFYRPNGSYSYQISATGYNTVTGVISVHDNIVNKTITLTSI